MFIIPTYSIYTLPTPLDEDMNGTATGVEEKVLECDFSFSISRDHFVNESSLVGHVGKDASMNFVNPGKYFESDTNPA